MYEHRLRALREDRDLSQKQLADLLKVHQTTYSDYEKGKVRIPIECLMELAKFYNVDMNYITGASNIKSEYPKKEYNK